MKLFLGLAIKNNQSSIDRILATLDLDKSLFVSEKSLV